MAKEIRADVVFREGMRFDGLSGRAGAKVDVDFAPEGQPLAGFSPLELLLTSLAGCSGQVTVGLLKRMGLEVGGLTVRASGLKKDIHPTVLTEIGLEFEFRGGRLDGASIEKALALSEDRFCPVWAMLKAAAPIKATYRILPE
jgi:putative redox protein